MAPKPLTPYQERMEVIQFLADRYKIDRYLYLALSGFSTILLASCFVVLLKKQMYVMAFGMFGATGIMTFSINGILTIWKTSLVFIAEGKFKK